MNVCDVLLVELGNLSNGDLFLVVSIGLTFGKFFSELIFVLSSAVLEFSHVTAVFTVVYFHNLLMQVTSCNTSGLHFSLLANPGIFVSVMLVDETDLFLLVVVKVFISEVGEPLMVLRMSCLQ